MNRVSRSTFSVLRDHRGDDSPQGGIRPPAGLRETVYGLQKGGAGVPLIERAVATEGGEREVEMKRTAASALIHYRRADSMTQYEAIPWRIAVMRGTVCEEEQGGEGGLSPSPGRDAVGCNPTS